MNEEKYFQWMEETIYGYEPTKEIYINYSEEELLRSWNFTKYVIRHLMLKSHHREILNDFPYYKDFDDYSSELFKKLVNKRKLIK